MRDQGPHAAQSGRIGAATVAAGAPSQVDSVVGTAG